jgi:hypothetical protein
MSYSFEKLIPGMPVEAQEAVQVQLRDRLTAAVKMLVYSIRAIEQRYGPEVMDVSRTGYLKDKADEMAERWKAEKEPPDRTLQAFCRRLEKACAGTHEWTRVIEEEHSIGYRFTRCMWAEIFRSLDAADIGRWICDSDEIVLKSFNKKLDLRLTKRLMDGASCCNHRYTTHDRS